ncbi:pyridoxamine 5'-phosphate oxidase-domain-containing protein [Phycomyces nitens]|nr:pyridoxamine 5'-phosphate oxidase-domain-containing protein [Phycomyces nitens]
MLVYLKAWLAVLLVVALDPIRAEDSFQDVTTAASLARRVLEDANMGTLATVISPYVQYNYTDLPFALLEYYSVQCSGNGDPLLFMSDLEVNAKNMHREPRVSLSVRALQDYNPGGSQSPIQQPRFSLLGEIEPVPESKYNIALSCFLAVHPEAAPWQKFHDFKFYKLKVKAIYYVGGYGGLNYIGWIPLSIYQEAQPEARLKLQIP